MPGGSGRIVRATTGDANPKPALAQRRPLVLVAGAGSWGLCCKNAAGELAKGNAGHNTGPEGY